MAEFHRGDQLLEVRVARILVENALRNLGGKRLASEIETVVFQQHSPGKESLPREGNREGLIHRPVVLRRELQVLVAHPAPLTGHLRGKVDPCRDRLVYLLQGRRGLIELYGQGLDG